MRISAWSSDVCSSDLRATIPYVRQEVPVVVIFRALGLEADKTILEHIMYDLSDNEMMERFRASLEEAESVQNQTVALVFIGKRGSAINVARRERVQYARELLQHELLPHVGMVIGSGACRERVWQYGYVSVVGVKRIIKK